MKSRNAAGVLKPTSLTTSNSKGYFSIILKWPGIGYLNEPLFSWETGLAIRFSEDNWVAIQECIFIPHVMQVKSDQKPAIPCDRVHGYPH